jgi:hypothetical protein
VQCTASFPDVKSPRESRTVPLRSAKPIIEQSLTSAQVTLGAGPGP